MSRKFGDLKPGEVVEVSSPEEGAALQRRASDQEPLHVPSHYGNADTQPFNFIQAHALGYHQGNAVVYIARAGKKEGQPAEKDLGKAIIHLLREVLDRAGRTAAEYVATEVARAIGKQLTDGKEDGAVMGLTRTEEAVSYIALQAPDGSLRLINPELVRSAIFRLSGFLFACRGQDEQWRVVAANVLVELAGGALASSSDVEKVVRAAGVATARAAAERLVHWADAIEKEGKVAG